MSNNNDYINMGLDEIISRKRSNQIKRNKNQMKFNRDSVIRILCFQG